ncbi:hypothetical protein F5Y04DRAFT_260031 [Hypomontagnella monticulosa]|nr:hypothetical protein F5Y04DRAFT_260031 [Hypomontagnella monticulosa]
MSWMSRLRCRSIYCLLFSRVGISAVVFSAGYPIQWLCDTIDGETSRILKKPFECSMMLLKMNRLLYLKSACTVACPAH